MTASCSTKRCFALGLALLTNCRAFTSVVWRQRPTSFSVRELPSNNIRSDDGNFEGDNSTLVTKEMFLREQLADPVVKRKGKKKKNGYKVLDNRDSLPFAVEMTSPDPYTHPETKKKNAKKNKVPKRKDSIENGIASSLYTSDSSDDDQDNLKTKLGEFVLDKQTTTGDLLEIGEVQYKVVRHRCQYKYAGGKRFVMVRKILEVKEVGRLQAEEYLHRSWKKEGGLL